MKVLCYNIQAGSGNNYLAFWNFLKSNKKILEQISGKIVNLSPDIIGLIEIDAGSFRSANQIESLAKKLKYNYASACKYGWPAGLPILKHQHLAILTKYKILEVKAHKFSTGFKRLALEIVVQNGKEKVSVIVTHLSLGARTRKKQIKELEKIIKTIKNKVVLMGDFNQENLVIAGLENCCTDKTFPAWKPKQQLDYVFTNAKVKSASALGWQLSDHLPVYAELEI